MGLWRLSDFDASRSMSMHPSLRVIIDPQVLIADVPNSQRHFDWLFAMKRWLVEKQMRTAVDISTER
jgi:hypothetical protein